MTRSIKNDQSLYTVFKYGDFPQIYSKWTPEEDTLLRSAVSKYGTRRWTCVSKHIPGRTAIQCSTRWMGVLNPNIHKGKWSKDENKALFEAVHFYQKISTNDQPLPWKLIAENVPCRNGIQCQARWTEALDPKIRKGRWSTDEDRILLEAKKKYGCCWVRVASMIPTRTQRQCRTRWNQIQSQKPENRTTKPKNGLYQRSQKAAKLPEPIQTYFSILEMDELLNQPLVSSDCASSAYSFDDPLESPDIALPYQPDYLYRKHSLENIHQNFMQPTLHTENDVYLL